MPVDYIPVPLAIMVESMTVFINQQPLECEPGTTLAELLVLNDLDKPGIATAIGNKVVRRDERATTVLTDGMNITLIHAVCGG